MKWNDVNKTMPNQWEFGLVRVDNTIFIARLCPGTLTGFMDMGTQCIENVTHWIAVSKITFDDIDVNRTDHNNQIVDRYNDGFDDGIKWLRKGIKKFLSDIECE